ncbi:MAG: hypothetical protein WAK03_10115, partial [Methylocystis sp.]
PRSAIRWWIAPVMKSPVRESRTGLFLRPAPRMNPLFTMWLIGCGLVTLILKMPRNIARG